MKPTECRKIFDDAIALARTHYGETVPQRVTERLLRVFYVGSPEAAREIVRNTLQAAVA